ncbi:hypothetical protein MBSD_n2273 [Mizugakiibacter sediminis]|uniref:Lipoprotein n=1 Tax=Mizugakiibacter sediminis TaxID=1475481 RepID=A0A0K8QRD3_9GAMM|nr:hypothetical protein MBSD_n2273 [Mizugakiibacter sediminis]
MLRASELAVGLLFGLGCGFAVVAYVGHSQPSGRSVPVPSGGVAAATVPPLPEAPVRADEPSRAGAPAVSGAAAASAGDDPHATGGHRRNGIVRCVGGKLYWIHKQGGVTVIEPYPPQPPGDCRASCT